MPDPVWAVEVQSSADAKDNPEGATPQRLIYHHQAPTMEHAHAHVRKHNPAAKIVKSWTFRHSDRTMGVEPLPNGGMPE